MLADGRRAHLETDAGRLAAGRADSLVSLDAGAVSVQPRDSVRAMFVRYFAGARYHAWEDVEPPRVVLSADRSLAWVSRVVCVDREDRPTPAAGAAGSSSPATRRRSPGRRPVSDDHRHLDRAPPAAGALPVERRLALLHRIF